MISESSCVLVGKVNKAHGLDGELSISLYSDAYAHNVEVGSCFIFDMDGIFTPFFVRTVRPRGAESLLIAFDGVGSQRQAQEFTGKQIYAIIEQEEVSEEDGLYAGQIIGFTAIDADTGSEIGIVEDIDDATANVLFIVRKPDGTECRIPAAEEFIISISPQEKAILFSLPVGLLDL